MTAFKTILAALLTSQLILTANPGAAAPGRDDATCESVKKQIREIEARMRNGYTAAQGIRYEERLKRLKDKRYKVCR